jgi:MerR family Zn(II)-responsive transcriptional regulator of zntA
MKIGELAKVTGVAAHTIRFYESKGLLPKASRRYNGYRNYSDESIESLARIQCAKRLGFSLEGILTVLADYSLADGLDHDKVLKQLDIRLLEVESLLQGLLTQRDEIITLKQQLQKNWQQGKCAQANDIFDSNLTTVTVRAFK